MGKEWVRSDGEGFLPAGIGALIAKLNGFPIARWNFLVLDPGNPHGPAFLADACRELKAAFPRDYQFQCQFMNGDYRQAVLDWARDLPLRKPMPAAADVTAALNTTLVKASLPLDAGLRQVLRADPFGSYETLLARLEAQKPMKLHLQDDFLIEPVSGRTLVPMLLAHDPLDVKATAKIEQIVHEQCEKAGVCEQVGYLGGHFASLENQRQIMADLSHVSISGIVLLLVALLGLKLTKLYRLLWLALPVGLGTLLAVVGVILMDGSIHGLTLSFGTGLIGLALDHGIHASFQGPSRGVWLSNIMGLLTTVVVLVVVAFTEIPVLRQLMIFSTLGLTLSFVFIYLLQRWRPAILDVKPLKLPNVRSRGVALVMALLPAIAVVGAFELKLDLNMQRLGFASEKTQSLYKWFGATAKTNHRFVVHASGEANGGAAALYEERAWADGHALRVESAAYYLPPVDVQAANRATWFADDCQFRFQASLDEGQRGFFAPYFPPKPCERTVVHDLDSGAPPAYVQHLANKTGWISILYPDTPDDVKAVKERFPESFSLPELVARFPELFGKELGWMAPLTLGLIVLMLLAYYRSAIYAAAAILPFFVGVGSVVTQLLVGGEPFNFLTMIALLMLCGLSVDYGVFAVDQWRRNVAMPEKLQNALVFCCLASALGVAPLVLAKHPVLKSLGTPLLLGVFGALFGALVAVPEALDRFARRRAPDA